MLKGIAACISPALLQVLSEMGCGDTLVLAGANFPAAACAKETILLRADGVGTLPLLEGILKLLPLDENVPNPVQLVERTSADEDLAVPLWEDYKAIVAKYDARGAAAIDWTDRYKFYTMATRAYAVVATGERAPYARILLQKGDVTPEML